MPDKKRVSPFPLGNRDFDTYIRIIVPYLNANNARLKINAGALTELNDWFTDWKNVFPKSTNPVERTPSVIHQRIALKKKGKKILQNIYADLPRSGMRIDDFGTLRIKKRAERNSRRPKIEDAVMAGMKNIGGAWIAIECRADTDQTRASIPRYADGVEMCYQIGDNAPDSPEACPKTFFSTRAKFILKLSMDNAGKRIYAFFRWRNNSDEGKSGSWSKLKTMVIGD